MSYTRPLGGAADFVDSGPAYALPPGGAADFADVDTTLVPVATGAAVLSLLAAGAATATPPIVIGAGAAGLLLLAASSAAHGVAGQGDAALVLLPAASARHGVAGAASVALGLLPAGVGVHARYQLRGQVLDAGLPVDRRVRAYRRSTGALVAQADSVAGQFVLDVGSTLDEFLVVPVDLAADATDWAPPAANRVLSVLAVD